jgi:GNAT superfamily N-acetyltransferase
MIRPLHRDEVRLLGTIDRSERIEGVYRQYGSHLELHDDTSDVAGWDSEELGVFIARLEALFDAGGAVFGAWHGPKLTAVASLDARGVGGDARTMKLDMLYVDAAYRRRGIGRELTEIVANRAREKGANALYISATPSRGTVDAYLRIGARVLDSPDPELLEREPRDVHLILLL